MVPIKVKTLDSCPNVILRLSTLMLSCDKMSASCLDSGRTWRRVVHLYLQFVVDTESFELILEVRWNKIDPVYNFVANPNNFK